MHPQDEAAGAVAQPQEGAASQPQLGAGQQALRAALRAFILQIKPHFLAQGSQASQQGAGSQHGAGAQHTGAGAGAQQTGAGAQQTGAQHDEERRLPLLLNRPLRAQGSQETSQPQDGAISQPQLGAAPQESHPQPIARWPNIAASALIGATHSTANTTETTDLIDISGFLPFDIHGLDLD